MKPIKLKIEGVKSFSSIVEIDFKKLLNAGMFGIFGDTGSGKSTMLESIICSLYSSKFKTEYINKRSNFAEVTFTFEIVINGVRTTYEVYRKFVKSGQPKAVLYEYKEGGLKFSIAEKQRQVDEKLEEILGLNCEEFESSIVLPQGKFDKFLTSTRINRIKIMESLFNLQKYGENLKQNIDRLNVKYMREESDYKGKLSVLEDYNLNVLNELKNQFTESANELKLATEKNNKINDYIEKYAIYYNGENRLKELENELKILNEKTPYFKKLKENISKLNDLKNYVELSENLDKNLSEKTKILNELKTLSLSLKNCNLELEVLIKNTEVNSNEIEGKTERLNALKVSAEKISVLNEQVENLYKNLKEISANALNEQSTLNLYELELKKLTSQLESLSLSNDFTSFDIAFKELEKSLTKNATLNEIKSERDFLNELKVLVKEISALNLISTREELLNQIENNFNCVTENVSILTLKELLDKKIELQNKTLKIEGDIRVKQNLISTQQNRLNEHELKSQSLKSEIDALNTKINAISKGENVTLTFEKLACELNALKKNHAESEKLRQNLIEQINEKNVQIASKNARLESLNLQIQNHTEEFNKLKNVVNLSVDDCRKIILETDRQSVINETENHFKKLLLLEEEGKKLLALQKNSAFDSKIYTEYLQKKGEIQQNLLNLTENFAKIKNNYEKTEQKYEYKCIIEKDYNILVKKMQLLTTLSTLVSSRKLLEFIADEYLAEICGLAKKTLFTLSSGKYGLVYDGEFFVTDNLHGGEKRQVSTLSGGETFIVSLSLALALSTEIHQKSMRPIEFFFLDEGFGTLDKKLTETVISCLDKLKNQNFTIGLISHVDELKEAVSARIDVTGATLTSGSTVKISAN